MDKKEWKIIDELKHAEETGSRQVRCSRVCL